MITGLGEKLPFTLYSCGLGGKINQGEVFTVLDNNGVFPKWKENEWIQQIQGIWSKNRDEYKDPQTRVLLALGLLYKTL